MKKIDYTGQQFGNRIVVKNECTAQDWIDIGGNSPSNATRFVLTKCLNCGSLIPADIKTIRRFPPKRCAICSNIGNRYDVTVARNTWYIKDDCAICNVMFRNQIVSFYIDIDRYDVISNYIWRISKKRNKFYVVTGSSKKGTQEYLHTMIIGKPKDGFEIDHIDGNSLNNRLSNLRIVTHGENVDNVKATRIDNEIGIRGISFNKKAHLYYIDFSYHNKRYYVKPVKTIEEAILCRRILENHFGLHMIDNNPLVSMYDTPSNADTIKEYIEQKILGNER